MSSAKQTPDRTPADADPLADPADDSAPGRTARVTGAAAIAAAEALALFAGGVYVLVGSVTGHPDKMTQAVTGGVTLIVLGLIPLIAARGLLRRRSWSRGPAVITQLMALPVAWTLLQEDSAAIPAGILLGALAITGLVLLFHPTTTRALNIRPRA
ncbi:hypothetical protein [Streptomyces lichenis]|uniref:Integral membrane protein n=1 Tax=Streptomyces lichenis TaxID=2306967 RepID=A0ABT0I7Q9_9ACTN|nr:hypothetical protein [Streptomyces lichenis]MCK8677360.1 hypothetical protein [Streptomyces lichenis]